STVATSPLGRQDLTPLVDPQAIEMDQDYDCAHNSNPLCSYTYYGPSCFPESSEIGTQIYTDTYGSFESSYSPQACPSRAVIRRRRRTRRRSAATSRSPSSSRRTA